MQLKYIIVGLLLITLGLYLSYAFSLTDSSYWWFVICCILPLCLPLSGSLKGNPYTIGYSSLLSTWYFVLSAGIYLFYDATEMIIATITSLLWFIACVIHNKHKKRTSHKSS